MKLRLALGLALILFSADRLVNASPVQDILGPSIHAAWNHAEQTKDVAALEQLLSPHLVSVDYDGSISTKQEYLANIKAEGLSPETITNEQQTVHVYGDCAVVTGIYREKGMNKGKPYNRRGRFTDTWIKVNDSWQCVATQSTLIQQQH